MKFKYILVLLVIMLFASVGASAQETPLRVGLYYASTAKTTLEISSENGFKTPDEYELSSILTENWPTIS